MWVSWLCWVLGRDAADLGQKICLVAPSAASEVESDSWLDAFGWALHCSNTDRVPREPAASGDWEALQC